MDGLEGLIMYFKENKNKTKERTMKTKDAHWKRMPKDANSTSPNVPNKNKHKFITIIMLMNTNNITISMIILL